MLGLLEGCTEFLPISSTGHLILAEHALGIGSDEFTKTFTIAIQLGAILAVVLLYGNKLLRAPQLIGKIAAAFIPMAIPIMLCATVYDLYKNADQLILDNTGLIAAGFVSAFVAAYITAPALLRFIKSHSFRSESIESCWRCWLRR